MNQLFNLKSFFTFLKKNKTYTFIDIFGFSVSLTFVIIIAIYSVQELSVDKYHGNGDRIYAVASRENMSMAYRLGEYLQNRFPEIEQTCAVNSAFSGIPVVFEDQKMDADLLLTDTTFFDMFTFELVRGDRKTVLNAPGQVVISETFARKMFGNEDPVGQTIRVKDDYTATVNGVMKDIRNSAINYCDIVGRVDMIEGHGMLDYAMSSVGSTIVFVQEKPLADLRTRIADMEEYCKEIFWVYQIGYYNEVVLIPLKDVYFSEIPVHSTSFLRKGNYTFVIILLSVGILILLFAVINYINLTVAQAGFRAKEMATRRLLGSERRELILRLIIESTVLASVSFVLAFGLACLLLPAAGKLLETTLSMSTFYHPLYIVLALLLILLVGVGAGLLPALYISNVQPVEVMKGSFRRKTKMVFSKLFITFQNMITISLVAASITMLLQVNHLLTAPLGYNVHDIMEVNVMPIPDNQIATLRSELARLAPVKSVGNSQGIPLGLFNVEIFDHEGDMVGLSRLNVDTAFINMFGIQIVQDNQLAVNEKYFLSEQALIELGLDRDAPSVSFKNWQFPVAGVISDLWLKNRNEQLGGILLGVHSVESLQGEKKPWYLTLEIEGDPVLAYNEVRDCYERITGATFDGQFLDIRLRETMAGQIKTSRLVTLFAFIAIVISLMGLFAMSTYFISQRSREVAIRKVFGSGNKQVLYKLVYTFLSYVLIAFLLVTPFIWYLMRDWLSSYNYRITLNPMIFVVAGLFCLFISFITVFIQSYKAANENPVESIKTE